MVLKVILIKGDRLSYLLSAMMQVAKIEVNLLELTLAKWESFKLNLINPLGSMVDYSKPTHLFIFLLISYFQPSELSNFAKRKKSSLKLSLAEKSLEVHDNQF